MSGFPGGLQQFMKQANQLQGRIKKLQEELNTREYKATAGGNAIEVVALGSGLLSRITIQEDVLKSGDVEMLQDLVLTAVNDAVKTAKESGEKEMEKLTGGIAIPGMF